MEFLVYFTLLTFLAGFSSWVSGNAELTADVRKNLPPEDIEQIYEELKHRRNWGLLLMVIAMFPVMIYLSVYL
jgi:uncharacterized membrane protein